MNALSQEFYQPVEGRRQRNIINNSASKTNLDNLETLKDYPYSSYYKDHNDGKMAIVYKCEYKDCSKEFLRTWNLLDHVRVHYGIKPYVCKVCHKGFIQNGNMKKHMLQHYQPILNNRRRFH
mmetsp:Transcript_20886/g.18512  ORF Transcript_20886/g.18512 Transcript_20886/m.18512 type:complete len:122 (+) Transcript_20886:174-539(+)